MVVKSLASASECLSLLSVKWGGNSAALLVPLQGIKENRLQHDAWTTIGEDFTPVMRS